jgi:hypothetical protein
MILEKIFQIRGGTGVGPFNTDFTVKIIFALVTVAIIIYDSKTNDRLDYLRMLSTGTIMWSIAELILQGFGMRDFVPAYLFGWEMPLFLQIPFQGMVEGATVAIICMFFGDRILHDPKKKKIKLNILWAVAFIILMILMIWGALANGRAEPAVGGVVGVDITSRRSMLEPAPVIFLSIIVFMDVILYIKTWKNDRALFKRVIMLTILMIIAGFCWTYGEWLAGTRWIEVGSFESSQRASPVLEWTMLWYDIIVEISLAYVPFIGIHYFLGHLTPHKLVDK